MPGKRSETKPVDLNMVPIMNLFLAMIPFLLMCAAFFQVSVINASVPALSEGDDQNAEPKKELKKITLNVQINEKGFVLSATGDQPEQELKKIGGVIPKKGGDYDYEKLAERAKAIHDRYPKSDTVILLPAKDVIYDTLVKTMDATRERILDKRLDTREHLFTNAVVSSLL
ncbi:MAG: biopolymer transporter ExbD [Deltaproteobacteria bacterium]|nr:MAG: biopolymer transporter ExbD [Deltaproteobacteria bacterium]